MVTWQSDMVVSTNLPGHVSCHNGPMLLATVLVWAWLANVV
jgi:hypothetical protein